MRVPKGLANTFKSPLYWHKFIKKIIRTIPPKPAPPLSSDPPLVYTYVINIYMMFPLLIIFPQAKLFQLLLHFNSSTNNINAVIAAPVVSTTVQKIKIKFVWSYVSKLFVMARMRFDARQIKTPITAFHCPRSDKFCY